MTKNNNQDADQLDELDDGSTSDDFEENALEESGPQRHIFTDKSDPPAITLHDRYRSGDLILDPIFQRRKVWDDGRSSRLIESVILEVPLPIFYLAENQNGQEEVIDGQQRLNALFRFLNNEYALKGLKALPILNGLKFKDLQKPIQRSIEKCSLRVITFKKESDENLRFVIFERLNTGAVPLNDQELRNCIYRGRYNTLLHKLAADGEYMRVMGLKTPEKRMKDVEFVLRFAAFFHSTYLKYKPSMARFLNEDMKTYQNISDEKADELKNALKTSSSLVWS